MNGLIHIKHPEFHYYRKGFCSIVNQIIDIAYTHYYKFNNLKLKIEDEQVLEFFDTPLTIDGELYDASRLWLDLFFNNKLDYVYNAHTTANKEFLLKRNFIYNNILHIKKNILTEFEDLKNKFIDDNTLAIHIRGTDKITELPEISIDNILKKINICLNSKNITSIMLCTDDIKYLNLLKKEFGEIIKFNSNNLISDNGHPLHFINNRKTINNQVLSDVFLISECKHFLYCYSNVSYLALTIGINNFETIEVLN